MSGLQGPCFDAQLAGFQAFVETRQVELQRATEEASDQARELAVLRSQVASATREVHELEREALGMKAQIAKGLASRPSAKKASLLAHLPVDPTDAPGGEAAAAADAKRWGGRIAKVQKFIDDAANYEDNLATEAAENSSLLQRRIHLAEQRTQEREQQIAEQGKRNASLLAAKHQLLRDKGECEARIKDLEQELAVHGGLLPDHERERRRAIVEAAHQSKIQRAESDRAAAAGRMERTEARIASLRREKEQLERALHEL